MKNYADAMIFHTAICAEASQMSLIRQQKSKTFCCRIPTLTLRNVGISMFQEITQDSFMSVMLCVLFLIYIFTDKSFSKKIQMHFFIITISILFLIVIDDLEMIEAAKTYPTLQREIYTALGYMIRPLIPVLMTEILFISTKTIISKIEHVMLFSIFVCNFIISGSSILTGYVFYYDNNNGFHRGVLGIMPFFAGFIYVIIMGYAAFIRIRIKRRGETVVFVFLGILCAIATALEALFRYVGFLTDVCIIGAVLYYLYLHVSIYSFDELTGTYTRRIFFLEANKISNTNAIIVTMDMNNLKVINDTKGHQFGDEALTKFSNTLVKDRGKNCTVYRMGGDEFAMICRGMEEEQVKRKMERLSEILKKKSITFAYGIAEIKPGENINDIMAVTDKRMYEMKRMMKADVR